MSIESYLLDGARSPIGLKNGSMVGVRSDDLSAMIIKGIIERNKDIPLFEVDITSTSNPPAIDNVPEISYFVGSNYTEFFF